MTQPFYFANGQLAHSAEDLLELCQRFPDEGVNHLVKEDFERWLAYIGKEDIARCATTARQTEHGDRQKLDEFLAKCHALSSPEAQPEVKMPDVSTPVEEAKPEPTPVATEATPAKPEETSKKQKKEPSFFRTIARLIVNVLYRNKS